MKLFEFDASDLQVKLAASTNQLKSNIDAGQDKPDWTVPELLQYYRDNDIIIDKSDLYKIIQTYPLKNYISNIQGDKVIFKGQQAEVEPQSDDSDKIVKQMAKDAMK